MSTPENPQAFPESGVWDGDRNQVNPVSQYFDAGGMTLRDYFAAKALTGMVNIYVNTASESPTDDQIAGWSYKLADAMLKARTES